MNRPIICLGLFLLLAPPAVAREAVGCNTWVTLNSLERVDEVSSDFYDWSEFIATILDPIPEENRTDALTAYRTCLVERESTVLLALDQFCTVNPSADPSQLQSVIHSELASCKERTYPFLRVR